MNFLINKFKGYANKPFVRNVAIVGGGSVAAQAIILAFSPILTRLYSPEAFGILGVFLATTALVTTVGSLTYQIAIVLPEKDSDAKAIASLSIQILMLISVIVMVILYVFKDPIVSLLQIQAIYAYLYLIPVYILVSGIHKVAEQWLIRKEKFKKKAKVGIIKAMLVNSIKTGVGLFKPIALVLIIISIIGQLLYAVMLSWGELNMRKFGLSRFKNSEFFDYSSMKSMAIRYHDFPLYRAPQAIIGSIASNTPILILTSFFGPASAGFYAIGKKALIAPVGLISSAVGQVFYPRVAKALNNGENIQKLLIKATLGLGVVGIVPFGTIILFGPPLFEFVFGSDWVVAGEYARWLSFWLYFEFVKTAAIQTIPVIRLQGFFLFYTVISTPLRGGVFILSAILLDNVIQSLALFCLISGAFSLLLTVWIIYKSKNPINE